MRWAAVLRWLGVPVHPCPVCGLMFIPNSSKGATVIMESWGPAGITLGSQVSSPTCHRHSGTYYDVDYVHHEDGNEAQVNSKPIEETRAKPRLPDWAN